MLKETTMKILNILMENKETFTSLNVTYLVKEYMQSNELINKCSVSHLDVAREVRDNYVDGLMDKKEYCSLLEKDNVEMNGKLYTTSIFYPKGQVVNLPFKITTLLKKTNKVKDICCGSCIATKETNKKYCNSNKFKKKINVKMSKEFKTIGQIILPNNTKDICTLKMRADGRLEIPQLILKEFNWLNSFNSVGESILYFSNIDNNSFFISKKRMGGEFQSIPFLERVRIPKSVFTSMNMSSDYFDLSYNKDRNIFIIKKII